MKNNLKVLLVSSEVAPFIKSGGLGDVAGSLPQELSKNNVDIRVVFPKYKDIDYSKIEDLEIAKSFEMKFGWRNQGCTIYTFTRENVIYYLVENHHYFNRQGLYDYDDDYERFSFFTKASLELLFNIGFKPEIVHFNDWQTGIGPVYLKDHYSGFNFYKNIKSLFTIHNIQYQGVYDKNILNEIGLNDGYFTSDKLEFYGKVNMLKAGIVYANAISTVSETYSKEIQTPEFGYGLDGVLRSRDKDLYGIINGIDYTIYNPETDKNIYENFSKKSMKNKYENKRKLQEEFNLPVDENIPLIGMVSRIANQKGFDILSIAMEELLNKGLQLIVLGTGEKKYEDMFRYFDYRYPNLSANILFSNEIAHKIYAGSDMFLMPSKFEPCGLSQMISMRYGTTPIVRRTGGLNDTVIHYDYNKKDGNGIVFNDYDAQGLVWGVNYALDMYYNHKEDFNKMINNAMYSNFSWDESAKKYIKLYNNI